MFKKFKRNWSSLVSGVANVVSFKWGRSTNYTTKQAMTIATVNRCVNLIADSVAKLELIPYTIDGDFKYKDYSSLYYLLNVEPNDSQNAFHLKRQIVVNLLNDGNSYILIERDSSNKILSLRPIKKDRVNYKVSDEGVVSYSIDGKSVNTFDLCHFTINATDCYGLEGVGVLTHAYNTIQLAYQQEQHQIGFFKSGLSFGGILKAKSGVNITQVQSQKAKEKFKAASDPDLGGVSNGIVVLDGDFEFQQVSANQRDSQVIESRYFSIAQICQFFGVPEGMVNAQSNKYAAAENMQIEFFNNCLQAYVELIEVELFRKLFTPNQRLLVDLKFDIEKLYRMDYDKLANFYSKMHSISGFTTNEIRQRLDLGPVTGGNQALVSTNLQLLEDVKVRGYNNSNNRNNNE